MSSRVLLLSNKVWLFYWEATPVVYFHFASHLIWGQHLKKSICSSKFFSSREDPFGEGFVIWIGKQKVTKLSTLKTWRETREVYRYTLHYVFAPFSQLGTFCRLLDWFLDIETFWKGVSLLLQTTPVSKGGNCIYDRASPTKVYRLPWFIHMMPKLY